MPGLRENIMERLSRDLIIDPEFAALIPPLTPDEFSGLEKSILEEGCRDALIVWGNIIVDGHNRFNICSKHNIPYRTEYRDFPNREAAMLWMLQNQLSRRNLNDFQRVEMVRKCEQYHSDNLPRTDVAYPVYTWGVDFDDEGKFVRLVNSQQIIEEKCHNLRVETGEPDEILQTQSALPTLDTAHTVILYHLDSLNLSKYSYEDIEAFYSR